MLFKTCGCKFSKGKINIEMIINLTASEVFTAKVTQEDDYKRSVMSPLNSNHDPWHLLSVYLALSQYARGERWFLSPLTVEKTVAQLGGFTEAVVEQGSRSPERGQSSPHAPLLPSQPGGPFKAQPCNAVVFPEVTCNGDTVKFSVLHATGQGQWRDEVTWVTFCSGSHLAWWPALAVPSHCPRLIPALSTYSVSPPHLQLKGGCILIQHSWRLEDICALPWFDCSSLWESDRIKTFPGAGGWASNVAFQGNP